nr:MAG TPA: hypothetical protein [Caudoviricetes sp.]
MREELIKNINENLESASEEVLGTVNDVLARTRHSYPFLFEEPEKNETSIGNKEVDEEESIERGLLFTRIVDFINNCNDISITDAETGELKALGVNVSGVEIIHPLLAHYIEVWIDPETVFKFHAQDPILMALKDLFEEISRED